jgi:hypothetical protein
MSAIPEHVCNRIKAETSAIIDLVDKKEDIRLVLVHFRNLASATYTIAEIMDDPDSRFMSFTLAGIVSSLNSFLGDKKDEWYKLNRSIIENIFPIIKKFAESIGKDLLTSNYEQALKATKTFYFVVYKYLRVLSD